jgi:integrase
MFNQFKPSQSSALLLDEEDIKKILGKTDGLYYRLALILGMNSGISSEELLGLRHGDIDLVKGRLKVVGREKPRTIMLPTNVLKQLSEGRYLNGGGEGFLFPFSLKQLNKYLGYCSRLVNKKLTWRDIRHSYAALAARRGATPDEVAANAGTSTDNIRAYFR